MSRAVLENVCRRTSSDLDYNVRRSGIRSVRKIIFTHFKDAIEDILTKEESINYSEDPILQYKRPCISSVTTLVKLLSQDDDWEVKKELINFIVALYELNRKSKKMITVINTLEEMTGDCDTFVSEYASTKLDELIVSGSGPTVKRKKQISDEDIEYENLLGDILLSLSIIHEQEKIISDFTDQENQDFADCY